MLTLVGFGIIIVTVGLLFSRRVTPVVALSFTPLIGALIAGFGFAEITTFFDAGLKNVAEVAVMFIFAILFFGTMQDVKLFDPLINHVIKLTRGNTIAVCVGTGVIGSMAHLDGSGASTFLITVPALLPLYKRLQMSRYLLLLIVSASIGVMNLTPWAGPIGRASAVTSIPTTTLWHSLIPVQLASFVLLIVFTALLGIRERKRIGSIEPSLSSGAINVGRPDTKLPPKFWFNLLLVGGVIAILATGILPPAYVFMLALGVAWLINYPRPSDQVTQMKKHAHDALAMAAIIVAAGAFLGVLTESGMLEAIAKNLTLAIPDLFLPSLHLIIGAFGVPLDMLSSTDTYYFALLPVVEELTSAQGVPTDKVVYAMAIGNNIGATISPFAPAMWLGLGLAEADMGHHIRYSFIPLWLFSLIVLIFSYFIGVI